MFTAAVLGLSLRPDHKTKGKKAAAQRRVVKEFRARADEAAGHASNLAPVSRDMERALSDIERLVNAVRTSKIKA